MVNNKVFFFLGAANGPKKKISSFSLRAANGKWDRSRRKSEAFPSVGFHYLKNPFSFLTNGNNPKIRAVLIALVK
jgi:hypothetical protein